MQILLIGLIIVFVVIFPIIVIIIYNREFGHRYEERRYESYRVEDFDGLQVEDCFITANRGQRLAGYKYSRVGQTPKGLLVFVHGLCGSHKNYLDVCDFFVSNGYAVFTYDATGNGESEGDKVGGFPQGLADLDCILNYVKELPEYRGLPIMLMGHSWGGFCVGNILNFHPDVKAVVSVSGFDSSAVLLKQYSKVYMGKTVALLMPYISLYERIKWGKYSTTTACRGFANTDAKVMIIHSSDDETVHMENGYSRYFEKFGKDDRFIFKLYSDRGHAYPVNSETGRVFRTKLCEGYFKSIEEGGEEDGEKYIKKHMERKNCMELDMPLMLEILHMFYQ